MQAAGTARSLATMLQYDGLSCNRWFRWYQYGGCAADTNLSISGPSSGMKYIHGIVSEVYKSSPSVVDQAMYRVVPLGTGNSCL